MKKSKKHLDGSGAGAKINAVYVAMKTVILHKKFKPDVISGISASALLGIPVAMEKWKILDEELTGFNLDTIFSQKPIGKKGKPSLSAMKNLVLGKPYLGKMGNLERLYRKIVTEYDFEVYKSDKFPPVYVSSIDYKTGKRNVCNLKNLGYEEMVGNVIASASIPVFTEAIDINGKILFDGGVRDHSIAYKVMKDHEKDITHLVSVFSRPKDCVMDQDWEDKNIFNVLERTIEIQNIEISKTDEEQQIDYCQLKGIKLNQIFMPSITKGTFDVDKDRLQELAARAREEAIKSNI